MIPTDRGAVCEQLKSVEEMSMRSKSATKNTTKKKAATKAATPPKALPAGLHKKQGVWVFSTGEPITHAQTERIRQSIYREREKWMDGKFGKAESTGLTWVKAQVPTFVDLTQPHAD
jgi:hypothetical protein